MDQRKQYSGEFKEEAVRLAAESKPKVDQPEIGGLIQVGSAGGNRNLLNQEKGLFLEKAISKRKRWPP